MKVFRRKLRELQPRRGADRRWVFIPYDQLSDEIGPLSREKPEELGIVLVENRWQLRRRPYHRQKLAWILANHRQFALEQAGRGVAIRYEIADGPYRETLSKVSEETGGLRMMEPAEREMRADLAGLVRSGALEVSPHEGWLTTHEQFLRARKKGPPWRMDVFYKYVRRETGLLMRGRRPLGGKFSFDPENRKPWKGSPKPPDPPSFEIDDIKAEVGELIQDEFGGHPGRLDLEAVPASAREMQRLWEWARRGCLPYFGPYEDAMSSHSAGLFHTRLSTAINLHRLLPKTAVSRAEKLKAPLASREGFIRQVLGWREFIRHVHLASDGFRDLPGRNAEVAKKPGDGGYSTWAGKKWPQARSPSYLDGGATPHALGDGFALPPAYWGTKSGLTCLDRVVADVWQEGWSHHITRLVVLSGLGTLLDVNQNCYLGQLQSFLANTTPLRRDGQQHPIVGFHQDAQALRQFLL